MRHSEWRQVSAAIEPRRGGTSQTWRNLGFDVSDKFCVEYAFPFPSVCEGKHTKNGTNIFPSLHSGRGIVYYG